MNNDSKDWLRSGDMANAIYNDYPELKDEAENVTVRSNLKFKDIDVVISDYDITNSKKHINDDYDVIKKEGLDKVILEKFIPWLKGNDYLDRDDKKILEGLKLYEVTYHYSFICAKYSPTNKDDYFGQFEFCFESDSEYTDDILEAVAMQVYIYNNEIVKVSGYDI